MKTSKHNLRSSQYIQRYIVASAVLLAAGQCLAQPSVSIAPIPKAPDSPLAAFAIGDLRQALTRTGHSLKEDGAAVQIKFDLFDPGMGPQAFRIRREGDRVIRVVGGDPLGAMYGGLDLAEMIRLGGRLDAVVEKARKPCLLHRGLKYNIPFDARGPSYDDTGTSAQKTIPVVWDFEFWREFLDTMARNRYNVLTLWTCHPFPGIVNLPKYPDIGYDDVCVLRDEVTVKSDRHWDNLDVYDPANFRVVKRISLEDKIAYWNRVFDHAEQRGIEIILFTWNAYAFGAKGKHGITDDMTNPRFVEYLRYAVGEFLKTYPQVDGIGITAGEHLRSLRDYESGVEEWLWRTYGEAVMDVKRADPDRNLRIIFRQHQASLGRIVAAFEDFDGPFNTGHKYARARLYSTTTSPYLDFEYRGELETHRVPCWLNLRNDDVFVFRWGDADYVREFLLNVPRDLMRQEAGFYMGPDGYVWGREYASKDPEFVGDLEMDKHWYRFMLWGRLGYDPTLPRDFFEARLKERFPAAEVPLLYDTWQAASEIVPQVNQFFFRVNDFQFAPEGCISSDGFLTVDDSFFKYPPLRGSGMLSVQEWARAVMRGEEPGGITPDEVADRLDRLADRALGGASDLRNAPRPTAELGATLTDIEAFARLGRYYAHKIRGAADLAVYRADPTRTGNHAKAVEHLEDAVEAWAAYARVATGAYHPQLYSRVHHMDWDKLLDDVKREVRTIRDHPIPGE